MHRPNGAGHTAYITLEEFEAARGEAGRFARYCRARLSYLLMRLLLPATLLVICYAVQDWGLIFYASIVLAGADLLEGFALWRLGRRKLPPQWIPLAQGATTLLAAVHGITAVVCVGALQAIGPELMFAASAICVGMVVDSLMQLHFHRSAAIARMLPSILVLGGSYIMMWADAASGYPYTAKVGDTAAVFLVVCFALSFVAHSFRQRSRSQRMQRATLQQADSLKDLNKTLGEARSRAHRLAHVVEKIREPVVILDALGHIEWVNAAFSQTTLFPAREMSGQRLDILDGPDTDLFVRSDVNAALAMGEAIRVDMKQKKRTGEDIWLDVSISPIREVGSREMSFVAVMRDIGEQKQREAILAEARAAAEAGAKAKTAFLATMSHEIRTPMNGVIATSELLLDTELDAEQRGLVETISNSGESLLTIINDILDFTKLDAGKLEISATEFSPRDLLNSAVGLVRPLAQAKDLRIDATGIDDMPMRMIGDDTRIGQVLLNLLGNAIKFTEAGRVEMDVSVVSASDQSATLIVAISDTGVGIAPERQSDIFETFTQADDTITRRFGGTGLGLAISKRISEAMGGDITLTSTLGEGSCFTFHVTLPIAEVRKAPKTGADHRTQSDTPFAGISLLVAEDNRTNRMLIEKMLKPTGAQIRFAENGAEAVRLFDAERPDAVLMDMSMPVMDGLEATQNIRTLENASDHPQVPIIALTANAFVEDRQRCLEAGMNDHLSKPIRKKALVETISSHVLDPPDREATDGAARTGQNGFERLQQPQARTGTTDA